MNPRLLNPLYVYRRRQLIAPYLRNRRQRAWLRLAPLVDRVAGPAARRGIALTPNDRRLAAFRDRHRGQRCFVIGNGPSLRIADLDRLQNEITFASNKIYLAFDQTAWRPTYFTVVDLLVAENNRDRIRDLDLPKFHVHHLRGFFPDDPRVIWLREIEPRGRDQAQEFSTNALAGVFGGSTVIYTQLQLAYYMGIREIYIIGVDFSFSVPKQQVTEQTYGGVIEGKGEINHFHPDYRKPGEKWTMPRLDIQEAAFRCARDTVAANGGRILNASRQTALEVFPRVSFDDVVAGPTA